MIASTVVCSQLTGGSEKVKSSPSRHQATNSATPSR
jgi:hypothetical protein